MASLYSWLRLMVGADLGLLSRPSAAPLLAAVLELVLALALLVFPSVLEQLVPSPPSSSARRCISRPVVRSALPVSSCLKLKL